MFGKKIFVGIVIFVILIILARNIYAASVPMSSNIIVIDKKSSANQKINSIESDINEGFIIVNVFLALINALVLIVNKKKFSKKCFISIFSLIILSIIIDYIFDVTFPRGGMLGGYETDRIRSHEPVFALILQIVISISIILKLRKGKNQPKCEKV